jgi:hypothetical protein
MRYLLAAALLSHVGLLLTAQSFSLLSGSPARDLPTRYSAELLLRTGTDLFTVLCPTARAPSLSPDVMSLTAPPNPFTPTAPDVPEPRAIDFMETFKGEGEIRAVLEVSGVDVNSADPRVTAVAGIRPRTLMSVIDLAGAFRQVAPESRLTLTGGCEPTHAENWSEPSRHSHATGYKYDLGMNSNNPALSDFIKTGRTL